MKTKLASSIWEGLDSGLATYLKIAASLSCRMARIWAAEATSAKLQCAVKDLRAAVQSDMDSAGVLRGLAQISNDSLDAVANVTNISHLVYATTLFDTFLSETTQFLFLLIPRAMGEDQQVPLRAMIEAPLKNGALTLAASVRTREIGNLPFADRIQFLRDAFALEIVIGTEAWEGMAHFSSVGSSTMHDLCGCIQLGLNGNGEVVGKEHVSATKIDRDDVRWAIDSYEQSARAITESVCEQILKQRDHPAVQLLLKGSTAMLELSPLWGQTGD